MNDERILNLELVESVVSRVSFRGWRFIVGELGDGFYVQAAFPAEDSDNPGVTTEQKGRKWYISRFALQDEIIKTCWVAVELALRHEALESFHLDGVAIFHPHTVCDALLAMQTGHINPREYRPGSVEVEA